MTQSSNISKKGVTSLPLYELTETTINPLDKRTFGSQGISERYDLQRLLKERIEVIAPQTRIIAEEFCEWEDSRRRIDLLGIDQEANLVVIELKRTEDGGHMELQAIRYAAMVSAMSFSKAVEVYEGYLQRSGGSGDAESTILKFLGWDTAKPDEFGQEVRLILVSAEFSKEITTSVLWLNNHGLDIRCVRLRPYSLDGRIILDVEQVIPLPEAADLTIQIAQKAEEARISRRIRDRDLSKYDLTVDGITRSSLNKRALVLAVTQAAITHGMSLEEVRKTMPLNKWIGLDGDLTAADFIGRLAEGHDPRRYFCDDGELFHAPGRTYALSNQWGLDTIEAVERLKDLMPQGTIDYVKSVDRSV
jgi:hypothetical protein